MGKENRQVSLLDKLGSVSIREREQSWVSKVLEILPQIEERLAGGAIQADIARAFGCSPRAFSAYIRDARRIAAGDKPKRGVGRPRKTAADYKPTATQAAAMQDKPVQTGYGGGYGYAKAATTATAPAPAAPSQAAAPRKSFNFRSDTSSFIEDDEDL